MDVRKISLRVASQVEEETSLDGLTKSTAKRKLNDLLHRYSKGLFRDTGWGAVHDIWNAMNNAAVNWELKSNRYIKDRDTGEPNSKEWTFEVYFYDKRQKFQRLHGVITAFAAGSVKDPFDRYDVTAYVS